MKFLRTAGLVLVGSACAVAPLSVLAKDEYAVSYSVAEMETYDGVQSVHARILKAAKQYCPTYSQIRSHADVRTCVEGVVDDLVDKINHPTLTGFHREDGAFRIATVRERATDQG